jgi:hypothetical protein
MAMSMVLLNLLIVLCAGCASSETASGVSHAGGDSVERAGDERSVLSTGSTPAPTPAPTAGPSGIGASDAAGILARPVVIGASVSAGAAARDRDGRTVDLAVALDGWIVAPHTPARSFASGITFLDPVAETTRQVEAAMRSAPSIVFALDACFWPVNARAVSEDERLARLDAVLVTLGAIDVPLVLGDVPDRDEAKATILAGVELATPSTRSEANRRIRAWAAARPNVVLVPLEEFVRRAAGGERS